MFMSCHRSAPTVPPVFTNGAWNPDALTTANVYATALLSKDVYYKHTVNETGRPHAKRDFALFSRLFCLSMTRLGADACE
jgi:hypothetical protein